MTSAMAAAISSPPTTPGGRLCLAFRYCLSERVASGVSASAAVRAGELFAYLRDFRVDLDLERLGGYREPRLRARRRGSRTTSGRRVCFLSFPLPCPPQNDIPEKPENAIAMSPAATIAIGIPRKEFGGSAKDIRTLTPAKMTIARVNPAADEKP